MSLSVKCLYSHNKYCGFACRGNVGELWAQHELLAREVVNDVLDIQEWLTHKKLGRESLIQSMARAFQGDLMHQCMGRFAAGRLKRGITIADEAGLTVNKLREISLGLE